MKILVGEQRTAAWILMLRDQLKGLILIDSSPKNRHELAKVAHTLVSQTASLGFTKLSTLLIELDDACVQRMDYTQPLLRVKNACREALAIIDQLQSDRHPASHPRRANQR